MANSIYNINNSNYLDQYMGSKERNVSGELGKNEFLNLLVAQLANQDPLEPQKDTDFIAQLAQFSQLTEMQTLRQSFLNTQASTMVGSYIDGVFEQRTDNGDGSYTSKMQNITGFVEGIVYQNGKAMLQVTDMNGVYGKVLVDPQKITNMVSAETIEGSGFNQSVVNSSALIGKHVYAEYKEYAKDEDGKDLVNKDKITITANGKVDKLTIENGSIYAHVGEKKFDVRHITQISDEPIVAGGAVTPPSGAPVQRAFGAQDETAQSAMDMLSALMQLQTQKNESAFSYHEGGVLGAPTLRTLTTSSPYGMTLQRGNGASVSDLLAMIQRDPMLLEDGEFDIVGEPDEDGAWG